MPDDNDSYSVIYYCRIILKGLKMVLYIIREELTNYGIGYEKNGKNYYF